MSLEEEEISVFEYFLVIGVNPERSFKFYSFKYIK